MIRDLRALYVLINNDKVLVFSTNLKDFLNKVRKIEAIRERIKSDSSIRRYFHKKDTLIYLGEDKKIYTIQKVL